MTVYRVELRGECREVFYVEADSEDEARLHWDRGDSQGVEAMGMDVESVTEEDE